MAMALELNADCRNLRAHPALTFRDGRYTYRITREENRSLYTVTDGANTFSATILYCFGRGEAGQTYVFERDGSLYESRVSFYKAIKGLDITLGAPREIPKSLDEAAGRQMNSNDARDCFGCHSTAAAGKSQLRLERIIPGVTCESCHGPGENHVAAVKAGNLKDKRIFNPGTLDTEELSNFCGSCHRTWEQVVLMQQFMRRSSKELGVNSVRFQPYRLTNSPCYSVNDKRISCTACHDPHENRQKALPSYDSNCTACHTRTVKAAEVAGRNAKICPVSTRNCVYCHMPKVDLPGSHFKFTDHMIRVVRPNESVW
jgi:hypothetical protein